MGILMFFLGTGILFVRGFMKKNTKIKMIILDIFLICLLLSHIRFGFNNFVHYFIINVGGILVLGLYSFFIYAYNQSTLVNEVKKLNIASYNSLTKRDCIILQKIQNHEKYKLIAKEEGMAEGTLKNRLHYIFTVLEVGDKQGFMSFYDDYELFFDPENIETAIPEQD